MPISDCEVRDPRIRRTRQLLQGALRTLLKTKSFEEISVQDITEAATVNRATFYDHYTDKYALFEAMVAGSYHAFIEERNVRRSESCREVAASIIRATCDYLVESHSGQECDSPNAFDPLMDAAIIHAIRRTLRGADTSQAEDAAELALTAASWAIYGAVKQWFANPQRPPVDEIVGTVLQMVAPILERAAPVRQGVESR